MTPFRLSAKETAQFMRKLAKQRVTSPLKRQGSGLGNPRLLGPSVSNKPPRMPADSHREECRCGIVMKFSWTDEGFANKFIAIWWKRHSGEGHGKVK